MTERPDTEVIKKIKKGEISYFEIIVKKYTNIIYRYLYKKIFEKKDVEDMVQNTFISFYKGIKNFDEKKRVLPYLFTIAKNEAKMYFRSKKPTVPLDETLYISEGDELESYEEDARILLKSLDQNQKEIFKLLYEGYTYQEIAKKLNKPLNTVKTQIRRARLKLKNLKNHEKT